MLDNNNYYFLQYKGTHTHILALGEWVGLSMVGCVINDLLFNSIWLRIKSKPTLHRFVRPSVGLCCWPTAIKIVLVFSLLINELNFHGLYMYMFYAKVSSVTCNLVVDDFREDLITRKLLWTQSSPSLKRIQKLKKPVSI